MPTIASAPGCSLTCPAPVSDRSANGRNASALNFDAMPPSEVRDRGHLVLTPLILAQPEEVVPTAAVSEKNGLEGRWEGVEAMDMVR